MSRPGILWYALPGSGTHIQVLPLARADAETAYAIECGNCQQRFTVGAISGLTYDAAGAISTVHPVACVHCRNWRVFFHRGEVLPAAPIYCPSCRLVLERPPRYGWCSCRYCAWEGRWSESLVIPPNPDDADASDPAVRDA